MKNYKKYKALYNTAYITFFSYLLILSVSNFDFGIYEAYIPYFIIIPFLIYCLIAVISELMMQKSTKRRILKRKKQTEISCNEINTAKLSNI